MPLNRLLVEARARWTGWHVRHAARPRFPVIYLPGILGVTLRDRATGGTVWGTARGLVWRDRRWPGLELDPGGGLEPAAPLHAFPIVPRVLETLVTVELRATLASALGYREGRDLFFLSYDWRKGYRELSVAIVELWRELRRRFGPRQRFIVIGQSAANLAMRHLVRTGSPEFRDSIAKWYAFGPVWRGTYNALAMARDGYYPAGRRFYGFSPDDVLSYPGCFQLLPRSGRLLGEGGAPSSVDLFDAECWADCGFGPPELSENWRHYGPLLKPRLAATRRSVEPVEGTHPLDASVPQTWFVGARNRAVVAAVPGRAGAMVTEREIRTRRPSLAERALAIGDDHIPLEHITSAPCGPLVTHDEAIPYGEDYVLIGRPKNHRALINDPRMLRAIARDVAAVSEAA